MTTMNTTGSTVSQTTVATTSSSSTSNTSSSIWMTATVVVVATLTISVVAIGTGGLRRQYRRYHRKQQQPTETILENNKSCNDDDDGLHQQQQQQDEEVRRLRYEVLHLQQQRSEERTGRIRAEVRLRTTMKQHQQLQLQLQQQQQQQHDPNNDNGDNHHPLSSSQSQTSSSSRSMILHRIGVVVSPYTKRMGTPRQGALVPASRGYIQFDNTSNCDVLVSGITEFSHVWILFEFHANTDTTTTTSTSEHPNNRNNHPHLPTKKSKIRPPRGNGMKMGQLATRSPHRPNPIGLSCVTLERYDTEHHRLYISGLDIVNDTPVYDIKPVVPWDIPGYYHSTISTTNNNKEPSTSSNSTTTTTTTTTTTAMDSAVFRVPDWVSNTDDIIESVTFATVALEQLQQCMMDGLLEPLYSCRRRSTAANSNTDITDNYNNTIANNRNDDDDDMSAAVATIEQILAQDPRSSHKGLKSNARGTTVTAPAVPSTTSAASSLVDYRLVFCRVQISFIVTEWDGCQVTDVIPIEFNDHQYVDGVPLLAPGVCR